MSKKGQEAHGGSGLDALKHFCRSALYRRLEQVETKLWHLGPVALFETLEE